MLEFKIRIFFEIFWFNINLKKKNNGSNTNVLGRICRSSCEKAAEEKNLGLIPSGDNPVPVGLIEKDPVFWVIGSLATKVLQNRIQELFCIICGGKAIYC